MNSRRTRLILLLVGVSVGIAWFLARRGPVGPTPRAQCLSDSQCESSERCVVVPKGDGFATMGQCGEVCVDDTGCPNGWQCRSWVEEKGFLSPERGRAPELPRVMACAHQSVQ